MNELLAIACPDASADSSEPANTNQPADGSGSGRRAGTAGPPNRPGAAGAHRIDGRTDGEQRRQRRRRRSGRDRSIAGGGGGGEMGARRSSEEGCGWLNATRTQAMACAGETRRDGGMGMGGGLEGRIGIAGG